MARIKSFTKVLKERQRVHDPVECGFSSFSEGGKRYLQLETYGSPEREVKGVASQTIQLDEAGAGNLVKLLLETFPRLRS